MMMAVGEQDVDNAKRHARDHGRPDTHDHADEERERRAGGGFKVVDRRRFTASGERRAGVSDDKSVDAAGIKKDVSQGRDQAVRGASEPASRPGTAPPSLGERAQVDATLSDVAPTRAAHARSGAAPVPTTAAGPPAQSASSVDFLSFIGSLATNAMAAMGLLPPSQSGGLPTDLAMAREYIDIIVMLEERTRGNVSPDEQRALVNLIEDLRLQLNAASGGIVAPHML